MMFSRKKNSFQKHDEEGLVTLSPNVQDGVSFMAGLSALGAFYIWFVRNHKIERIIWWNLTKYHNNYFSHPSFTKMSSEVPRKLRENWELIHIKLST